MANVLIDDRLLISLLLTGLDTGPAEVHTTMIWYYRTCRAAAAGAGGQLSGPFEALGPSDQRRSIAALLDLPDSIVFANPRSVVPEMASIAARHTQANLLALEAAATASVLEAEVWLSPPSAAGPLPAILSESQIRWRQVSPT